MIKKSLLMMLLLALLVPWAANAQTTVEIGNGTTAGNFTPIGTYYNYSITEQLYTAEEIGMAGTISSISFNYAVATAKDFPIEVYMQNVDAADLSTGISLADAELVFEGTLSVTEAGWVTIDLDTPFAYDGTSNLLIGVNKGYVYWYSGSTWVYTAATNMARYSQNDNDAYTTSTTPGTVTTNRPNIQMVITPSSGPVCERPATLEVSNVTANSATLTWTGGSGTYNVEYKGGSAADWTAYLTNTNSTSANLTGLTPGTAYQYRVQSVCGSDVSGWKSVSFQTMFGIPINEAFATTSLPAGWAKYSGLLNADGTATISTTTSGWSFGTSNGVFDSHVRVNIYGTSCNYWLVTPAVLMENNVQLTFDLALTAYSGTLGAPATTGTDDRFTVLITTNGGETWTTLRQWDNAGSEYVYNNITSTATGEFVAIDLSSYAGQNIAIAFYGESTVSNADNNLHIDNVSIDYIPACAKPTGLAASDVTAHEATITWTSAANDWQICVNDDEENLIDVSDTTYTLTGLAPETAYTVKVRANCGDDGYSDWTDNVSFTTDVACPAPTGLTVSNITGHTATLNWQGTSNEYQVRYRTAGYMVGIEEGFSSNPAGWSFKTGALNADGTATLSGNTSWNRNTSNGVFDTHIYMNMYSTKNYWLITPSMEIKDGDALSLDMAYTAYSGTQAAPAPNSPTHRFAVLISTDDMQHWTILREWNNSGSEYVLDAIPTSGQNSGNIDLSAYAGQTAYIAFFGHSETSSYDNNFHFDNVAIGTPVPAGEMQYATNITEETVTLQGLLAETEYEAWLQGDCGSEGPSTEVGPITFTTDVACPAPTGLAATEISGYTAKLNWTGYSESYIVYYRAAIYKAANLAGEWETVSVDEPPCILAGLTPETTYEAKVQGDCGDDGLSLETYITFTTDVACPAPTVLTVSNITGHEATINWTSAAEAWQICVNDDEENLIDVAENTYTLTGLTPETAYTVKVRANCGDEYSDWTNNVSFTTLEACPAPTGFAVAENGLTGHTATLNWQGTSNEYQVSYRTAAYMDGIEEGFNSDPEGWSYKTGALNADGTATLSDNTSWSRGTRNGVFDTHIYMNMYSSSVKDYWLITSSMEIQNGYALSFDMAYTAYNGTQATPAPNSPTHRFAVLISTDDMQHWTILREWNNSGSEYVLDQVSTSGENSGNIDLSAYAGQTAYIAFFGHAEVTNYDNNFHFDNVAIGIPVPAGEMQYASNITEETVTLQGLLAETEYEAWLQGDCGSEGPSTEVGPITFTTLDVIVWNNPDDWPNDSVPEDYADVTVPANTQVIVPSGYTAYADEITIEEGGQITIEDGGQFYHSNEVPVTMQLAYDPNYTSSKDGEPENGEYRLIAAPVNPGVAVSSTGLVPESTDPNYDYVDLYYFDQNAGELVWINYKNPANNFDSLFIKKGYLYSNAQNMMGLFAGNTLPTSVDVKEPLEYNPEVLWAGWNLVGNPFTCMAFVNRPYYKINGDGDAIAQAEGNSLEVFEGVFVLAEQADDTVTFSTTAPDSGGGGASGEEFKMLTLNLNDGRSLIDRAIVRFDEGRQLLKLQMGSSTKVYIPKDGSDYAIVSSDDTGEMPVSFKAENDGTYTMNFSSENVNFSYLHLIDNKTGDDIDLLETPSYSFEARTTDYASRFKLVFCTGNTMEDNFAFYSNGSFVINNEGEATLQVIDVTGRIVKSESINGSTSVNVNAAAGVYMLRLINGNDVKVQKIVVR